MKLRKIHKQSCTAFQNVLVYEASTLWKKPSNLRCSCTTNARSEKCSKGWRLFSDAYRSCVPSLVINACVHGNFHCIYHKYLHVLLVVKETVFMASQWVTLCLHIQIKFQCKSTRIICCWVACSCSNISLLSDIYAKGARVELSGLVSFGRTIFSCTSATNDNTTMDVTV